jgi:diguanylate cyclase (GGDEF)-like protein/PAS domain S-box-containing protein
MTIAHVLAVALAIALCILVGMALGIRRVNRRESDYRRLLDQMPNSTVVGFDKDLRIQFAFGQATRDRPKVKVVGQLVEDVLPDSPATNDLLDKYRATLRGEEQIFEYRSEVTDTLFTIHTTPVTEGGDVVGGIAKLENISVQRRTEGELTTQSAQRRLILDGMNEAYVSTDEHGMVMNWNRSAETTFGWSAGEATGRWLPDLIIPAEDRPEFKALLARTVPGVPATGRVEARLDREAIHKDGSSFPVELALTMIEVDGKTELHTLMHDISDRKYSEAKLREHAADVEAIVDVIGELSRSTVASEARAAICRAATGIAEADVGALFEPDPSGTGLRATASESMRVVGDFVHFGERSAVARTFSTREPYFASDVVGNPSVSQMIIEGRDVSSALWVPVTHDDQAIGVIVVAWKETMLTTPPRLTRVMGVIAAEAAVAIERAALLDRLERMAHTDDLTGLINRRAWDLEVVREVARARRDAAPLAVAMLDLDRFKNYNDQHGHQAGDRVLHEAASAWRGVLRETDLLARYGGEEFAVALPGCARQAAEVLVERLREVTPAGQSCSAGLALWNGSESAEELLGRADRAMYEAKQAGRDRTVIA